MSQNIFESMGKKQAFVFGIVGGVLVLCTIGFFIMVGIMATGSDAAGNTSIKSEEGPKKFSQCLDSGETASIVKADAAIGASLGVQVTPGSFINGYMVSGAYPFEAIKELVDAALEDRTPNWDTERYGELEKVDMPEDIDSYDWVGNKNAKVSIVEFSDFECPYCSRYAATIHQVLDTYGDDVKYSYKHFTLSFHQNAQKAAEAFECAREQGKWLEMHDKLFELAESGTLSVANYKKAASEIGLK